MKKLTLIITLFSLHLVCSQNFKFGKVSVEELQETTFNNDPTINAAILYKERKIFYDFRQDEGFVKTTEIYERIKIYNNEGFEYGTRIERLYNETDQLEEHILSLKANTYNLEGGKIVETKLKKNGIFEEEANKYWKHHKMTMPNLKPGCIVEFKYSIESPMYELDDDSFQANIPIKKLDYKLNVPDYFVFNKVFNPRSVYKPTIVEGARPRKLLVSYHPKVTSNTTTKYSKDNLVERTYDITEKTYEAHLENIPALKNEIMVDNLDNYRATVKWDLVAVKSFDGITTSYSNTWDLVTKTIFNREDFGGQLDKSNYFESDLDPVLKTVSDPIERIATIYAFTKAKVKWNGYVGFGSDHGVKKAFKEGEGNVADINLMLTAMLRYAGFNANPVLLSTRDNGIPIAPTTKGFNYVITAVETPQGMILLDATNAYASANLLPTRAINWQGRIVRSRDNSDWVNLNPTIASKEVTLLNIIINEDLSVTGKVRNQYTNHLAMAHRNQFNHLSTDSHIMFLEKDKGDVKISNIETKGNEELSKPIMVSYDYTFENGIEAIGDKLYLSPLIFFTPNENPFKQDERQYPINFVHPISESFKVNITLPDGYKVESLPENSKIKFNDSEATFSYLAQENGNILQLVIDADFNKLIILPKDYEQFKIFFQLMIDKKMEKIILSKA